jgi:hypothetical protein
MCNIGGFVFVLGVVLIACSIALGTCDNPCDEGKMGGLIAGIALSGGILASLCFGSMCVGPHGCCVDTTRDGGGSGV